MENTTVMKCSMGGSSIGFSTLTVGFKTSIKVTVLLARDVLNVVEMLLNLPSMVRLGHCNSSLQAFTG